MKHVLAPKRFVPKKTIKEKVRAVKDRREKD